MVHVYEWTGSIMGLVGAFLLATHTSYSRYAWYLYLVGNVAIILFALRIEAYGLLTQQFGLMALNFFGLYRSGALAVFKKSRKE